MGSCGTSTAFRGAVGKDSSDQIALLPSVTDTQPTLVTLQLFLVPKKPRNASVRFNVKEHFNN